MACGVAVSLGRVTPGAGSILSEIPVLRTARLTLRGWQDQDRDPFAALNADPEVMEHFPGLQDRAHSDTMIDRAMQLWAEDGFCWWAVEADDLGFIGFTGLARPRWDAPITPCVEIGWRLARRAWGHGFAPEAARAALDWGFRTRHLDEIVSFTVPANTRSRAVMERIGLQRMPDRDFGHPRIPPEHPLHRHVVYAITRDAWASIGRA